MVSHHYRVDRLGLAWLLLFILLDLFVSPFLALPQNPVIFPRGWTTRQKVKGFCHFCGHSLKPCIQWGMNIDDGKIDR